MIAYPDRGLRVSSSLGFVAAIAAAVFSCPSSAGAGEIFEATSPYHHVRVVDYNGMRTLCFDDAWESRMSLANPIQGHFEYTEYFHMPWLWNTNIQSVLMIGLGGASTQRLYEHYYPAVKIETVEIDPVVQQVAHDYFQLKESDMQQVHLEDGRVFLRRTQNRYDLILLDAYTHGRYGSAIPQHLATKEFFELVRDHLTTNGIVAYNVIGSVSDWHADLVGAFYRTLKTVFPQVYLFPARTSKNVVLLATKAAIKVDVPGLRPRAAWLTQTQRVRLPAFRERLESMLVTAPPNSLSSPILTDDFAPVEGLAAAGGKN